MTKSNSTKPDQVLPNLSSGRPSPPVFAFEQGYAACDAGVSKYACPYKADSELRQFWRDGWEKRFYNE
jgi:ribosome modulation factor